MTDKKDHEDPKGKVEEQDEYSDGETTTDPIIPGADEPGGGVGSGPPEPPPDPGTGG